jgi:Uma2 family endonuclease
MMFEYRKSGAPDAGPMSIPTTPATSKSPGISTDRDGAIPPLENGDRLTREEFMRRYEAMPSLKKAELIDGMVYVPSPVSLQYHGEPHLYLGTWFVFFRAKTPGTRAGDNSTVLLDLENAPQPDAVPLITPEHGERARINEKGYIVGAPDLVAEVAASSASLDLHDKLLTYQ